MNSLTLARPYAKAAFEYALDQGAVNAWATFLKTAGEVLANSELCTQLNDPMMSEAHQYQMLVDSFQLKDKGMQNFFHMITDNHRVDLLPYIHVDFENLKNEYEKTIDVDVTAAMQLTDAQNEAITKALEHKLQRKISLQHHIDETILGGVIIRAGDLLVDGSGLGRLKQLRKHLEGNALCH